MLTGFEGIHFSEFLAFLKNITPTLYNMLIRKLGSL